MAYSLEGGIIRSTHPFHPAVAKGIVRDLRSTWDRVCYKVKGNKLVLGKAIGTGIFYSFMWKRFYQITWMQEHGVYKILRIQKINRLPKYINMTLLNDIVSRNHKEKKEKRLREQLQDKNQLHLL